MLPEYNGWTNYPTWCVHLWITNDQGMYESALEIVGQEYKFNVDRDGALQDWITDYAYDSLTEDAGFAVDLLLFSLAYVEWPEIVNALREES